MPWYTITDSFDADFGVAEYHGHNAFIRDGERVFRTCFINWRGDEAMGTVWSYLDMTALGRQETWEDSPNGYPQTPPYKWWNWHDNYDGEAFRSSALRLLRGRSRARRPYFGLWRGQHPTDSGGGSQVQGLSLPGLGLRPTKVGRLAIRALY